MEVKNSIESTFHASVFRWSKKGEENQRRVLSKSGYLEFDRHWRLEKLYFANSSAAWDFSLLNVQFPSRKVCFLWVQTISNSESHIFGYKEAA